MGRVSIAATLGWVGLLALGLAALVNASWSWAGATTFVTLAALLTSVVGLILRGRRGGGWLGFAVFGWGCLLAQIPPLALAIDFDFASISRPIASWVFEKANPPPELPAWMIPASSAPIPSAPSDPAPPPPSSPPPVPIALPPQLDEPAVPPPGLIVDSRTDRRQSELEEAWERRAGRMLYAQAIGHHLFILAFAGLGSIVGTLLARRSPDRGGVGPVA